MKKLVLIIAIFAVSLTAKAQLEIGVNAGIPIGKLESYSTFTGSVEANYYLFGEDAFKAGVSASYLYFSGKEVKIAGVPVTFKSTQFLPIAANFRYAILDKLVLGTDLGYGLGLSPKGNEGGFYIRPSVGFNVSDKTRLQLSFTSIDVKDGTDKSQIEYGTIAFGVVFGL